MSYQEHTEGEDPSLSPFVISLAQLLTHELIESTEGNTPEEVTAETDAAYERVRQMTPSFLIGRAAMVLTGEDTMTDALDRLFDSRKIQKRIVEEVEGIRVPALTEAETIDATTQRINKLRKVAEEGSIPVSSLKKGEVVTLFYRNIKKPQKSTYIEVMRDKSGDDNDKLSLTIINMSGQGLAGLTLGATKYLGYSPSQGKRISILQKGAFPVWADALFKKEGEDGWYYTDPLHTDTRHVLQQAYYGPGNQHPLF